MRWFETYENRTKPLRAFFFSVEVIGHVVSANLSTIFSISIQQPYNFCISSGFLATFGTKGKLDSTE